MVLCTATAGNLRDVDFLPLTVDVEERMYAAGKIPGSFFKREGRAGEKGTLTARMIDRPIRPLFPKGWTRETQIVAIPMSVDHVNPYDILAMNGASRRADAVRHPVPGAGRRRAHRQGRRGQLRRQPRRGDAARVASSTSIVAGTDDAILMVEAGANEVTEAEILDALDIAHEEIKKLCAGPARAARAGRQAEARGRGRRRSTRICYERDHAIASAPRSTQATQVEDKLERQDATKEVEEEVLADVRRRRRRRGGRRRTQRRAAVAARLRQAREGHHPPAASRSTRSVPTAAPPTRSATIWIEVGVAPRTHGSALFTRGQTQALLGRRARHHAARSMRLDTLGLQTAEALLPPLQLPAVLGGEAGFMRGPKRRDIGHGALAERALVPVIPSAGGVPVHDPRRLRHPRVERLVVDGVGLRLDALADGRGRADQASRWPASRWA